MELFSRNKSENIADLVAKHILEQYGKRVSSILVKCLDNEYRNNPPDLTKGMDSFWNFTKKTLDKRMTQTFVTKNGEWKEK